MRYHKYFIALCVVGTLTFPLLEASNTSQELAKEETPIYLKARGTMPVFSFTEINQARSTLRDHTRELTIEKPPLKTTESEQPTLKDLFLAEVEKGVELTPTPCKTNRPTLLSPLVQNQVRSFISPDLDGSLDALEEARFKGVQEIKNAEQLMGSERLLLQNLESFSGLIKNKALQESFLTSSKKCLSTQVRTELETFIKIKNDLEERIAVDLMEEESLALAIETQKRQVKEKEDNLNLLKNGQVLRHKERRRLLGEKARLDHFLQRTHEKKEFLLKELTRNAPPLKSQVVKTPPDLSQALENMARDCLEDALKDPEISALLERGFKILVNSRTGLELHQPVQQGTLAPASGWSFNPFVRFFNTQTTTTQTIPQADNHSMDLRTYSATVKKLAGISARYGWTPLKELPCEAALEEKVSTIAATNSTPIIIPNRQETSGHESTSPSLQARSPLSTSPSFRPEASIDLSMMGSMIMLFPEISSLSSSPNEHDITEKKMSLARHNTMGVPCGVQSNNGLMGPTSPRRLL
ncbi:MAG: hypothetical protein ACK5YY_05005 [Alphaproteobacteria bacterium]|jgi:hypothetical protein